MHFPSRTSRKAVTVTLAAAALLAGCGAFATKDKASKADEQDLGLTGAWRAGCADLDWLGLAQEQSGLVFSALGDFERTTTAYTDDACETAATMLFESGTYAALEASSEVDGANDINFTITEAKLTPESADAAKLLNDSSYCGSQSWKKGEAKSILDKECLGRSHAKGEVVFDIYRLEADDEELLLGKGTLFLDKTEADSRPTKLDESKVFERQ